MATKIRTCEGTCKAGYRSDASELTSCSDVECASWVKPCSEHACYFASISSSSTPTHACVVLDEIELSRSAEGGDALAKVFAADVQRVARLAAHAAHAVDISGAPIVDDATYFVLFEGACYGLISGFSVRQSIRNGSLATFQLVR